MPSISIANGNVYKVINYCYLLQI